MQSRAKMEIEGCVNNTQLPTKLPITKLSYNVMPIRPAETSWEVEVNLTRARESKVELADDDVTSRAVKSDGQGRQMLGCCVGSHSSPVHLT